MQHRQITLEDGRYLIFYTFDEETTAAVDATVSSDAGGTEKSPARADEPDAEPQATEERRV
ncbi:MAG TPA: hypothetical protein VF656_20295 [Pyrinomonadaceae bacterium]|jgi:hypothetical protein